MKTQIFRLVINEDNVFYFKEKTSALKFLRESSEQFGHDLDYDIEKVEVN